MTASLKPPVGARDHATGPADAGVVLVEYGDYECPYCGEAQVVLKELLDVLGDRVRFVFRNFPLATVHPHAMRAAEAAEAAGVLERFWPMHDLLFENQDALDEDDLARHAAGVGVDPKRFAAEMASGRCAERVREDFSSGVRSGVNGTPTFFIDGRRHDGGYRLDELLPAVEAALAAARRHGRSGKE